MSESFEERAERVLPAEVRRVIDVTCRLAGEEETAVWVVGGVVRDVLLGRPTRDLDLVARGEVELLATRMAEEFGSQLESTPFGTFKLEGPGGVAIDLATARRERYERPGELPRVEPGTLDEDLRRRDVTINAMAAPIAPSAGDVIDPTGGQGDLAARRLRVLHGDSFLDDPTRLLRVIDLAVRLGFELEPETRELALEAGREGALDTLSGTRLRAAWRRALAEQPEAKLETARSLGLTEASPEEGAEPGAVSRPFEEPLTHLRARCRSGDEARALARRLDLAPPIVERWATFPARLAALEEDAPGRLAGPRSALDAALAPFDEEELLLIEALGSAPSRELVQTWRREVAPVRLSISGRHLRAAGADEGEALGRVLADTLRARIDGAISAEQELEHALSLLEERS